MADTRKGRDKKAHDEERRQLEREIAEELDAPEASEGEYEEWMEAQGEEELATDE